MSHASSGIRPAEEIRPQVQPPRWADPRINNPSLLDANWNQLQPLSLLRETDGSEVNEAEIPLRPMTPIGMNQEIDCRVSAWSTWSECTQSCGTGWQTRTREVLINPSTYGKSCPKKMKRKRKCRHLPCPADTKYWYQGSWRHMVDPVDE